MGDKKFKFDAEAIKKAVGDAASSGVKIAGNAAKAAGKAAGDSVKNATGIAVKKAENVANQVTAKIDVNGNGEIDIEDFVVRGLQVPGIKVDRKNFLEKELNLKFSSEVITKAVNTTPAEAGITPEELESIADNVIEFERKCVTGISAALGMPGGFAMAATIPADIVQYYGYMLRAAQKLMYLYGFQQIETASEGQVVDSETMNLLILCLGVMHGVAGANAAIAALAGGLAKGVEKQLLAKALTKGTIYPIVKKVAKWFGVKMTKQVFAGFFKKAIPVVGGVVGGGITYLSFKPCCEKLKDSLKDTILSNPHHVSSDEEKELEDKIFDAEISES